MPLATNKQALVHRDITMNTEISTVRKIKITELERLDPITVYIEDLSPGRGKITVECYGRTWSSFWPAMGKRSIAQFFVDCNEDYIANNFVPGINDTNDDWNAFASKVKARVLYCRREGLISEEAARDIYEFDDWASIYNAPGDAWPCIGSATDEEVDSLALYEIDVPQVENSDYKYLCLIITTVQAALKELDKTNLPEVA